MLKPYGRLLCALLALALLAGCSPTPAALPAATPVALPTAKPTPAPTPSPTPAPPAPFSLVWISDTQNMSADGFAPVRAMADWIAAQKEALGIRYVLHTGDIVGSGTKEGAWDRVAPAMEAIRRSAPLMTSAGNHDVGKRRQYETYLRRRFDTVTDPGQLFQNGRGSYALLDTDLGGFLLVGMGVTVSEEGFDWLNSVFASHPERTGILAVHDYLTSSGGRTSEGARLFERVVKANPNLRFVLCGHRRGVNRIDSPIDDDGDGQPDRTVYQLMYNFQSDTKRMGYLRILTFSPDRSVQVTTYSPWLDDYDYYEDRQDEEAFRIENAF